VPLFRGAVAPTARRAAIRRRWARPTCHHVRKEEEVEREGGRKGRWERRLRRQRLREDRRRSGRRASAREKRRRRDILRNLRKEKPKLAIYLVGWIRTRSRGSREEGKEGRENSGSRFDQDFVGRRRAIGIEDLTDEKI
jgi:hypothetical protein